MQLTNFHEVREHWESASKMQKHITIVPGFQVPTKSGVVYDRIHRGACNLTKHSLPTHHSGKQSKDILQDEQSVELSLPTSHGSVQSMNCLEDHTFDEISTQGIVQGELSGEIFMDEHREPSYNCENEDVNKSYVSMCANRNQDEIQIKNVTILIPGERLQDFDISDDEHSITIGTLGSTASVSTDGHSVQTAIFSDDEKEIEDSCEDVVLTSKIKNNTHYITEGTSSVSPYSKFNHSHDSPQIINISIGGSREITSPLPDRSRIKKTGFIFSRLSARSMFMRRWHQTFWVQYGASSFLIFRRKNDFEQWLCNPHYTKKERDKLVKLRLKFCDRIDKKGGNSKDSRMSPMKLKYCSTNAPLYCFKLEHLTDFNVNKTIAFASDTLHSVLTFRRCLHSCFDKVQLSDQKVPL